MFSRSFAPVPLAATFTCPHAPGTTSPASTAAHIHRTIIGFSLPFTFLAIREPSYLPNLILRGPLHMVDDQHLGGNLLWLQLQPKLFLNRGE